MSALAIATEPAPPRRRHLDLVHSRRRSHGTRARYVRDRCRCRPCRAANAAYARARKRRPVVLIPAGPIREHLEWLRDRGIGYRQVAAESGVPERIVFALRSGDQQRVSVETHERLAAVTWHDIADGALVDASPTWELVRALQVAGWPKARIASRLGAGTRWLQLGHAQITAGKARAVAALAAGEGVL